jgi:uncharacterized membrane protein YphA (DoxX/SURF4 family)
MPFQPLQDSDPDRPRLADLGLLVIRLLAVATFAYYQLVRQLHLAVDFLWEGAEWDLVSQLAGLGLPSPDLIASASVGLQIVTLLGVVFGIFTRINALLFALMIGFVLFSAISLSASLNPQALALYLAIFLGLACGGAGRLALDHLLVGRRARKRAV